jgi:CRP-like cAMP-binding protein
MSLLTGEKRSATVSAATDSVVFEITRDSFNNILSVRNNIIDSIGESIAARKSINEKRLIDENGKYNQSEMELKNKLIKSIKSVFKIK